MARQSRAALTVNRVAPYANARHPASCPEANLREQDEVNQIHEEAREARSQGTKTAYAKWTKEWYEWCALYRPEGDATR